MGRTNPTYRNALDGLESEWKPMGRALRRAYREDFDRLFDRARAFADAAGYANPADPERALLLSILLAHEVENRRGRERVDALDGRLAELEDRFDGRVAELEDRFDGRITELEDRLETLEGQTERDDDTRAE